MSIKIRIVSDFDKKGLTEAEKGLNNLSKAAGVALAAVAAATAAVAVKSVQEFAKFDAAMTQSTAIMGDLSDAMRDDMANAAREVAKVTTFTAEEAGQSFFYLASAGLDAAASIEALPRVAQFAQAGMFDMSRATDLLTDAQSALGLTIRDDAIANMENMVKVSDVLVRANTLSNATVEQFSTSLTTKAGPALRSLGKDMEEGVAVLAAFADQGIKGEEAGTQLSIVLRDLSTKAIQNKEDFAQFGVAVFDSQGEMNNLGDIISDLETALGGMSDETKKATLLQLGFADRSVQSILALLGTSDAIKGYERDLRSASGFTEDVAAKQLDTFNAQLKLLESAFMDVAIQIGQELTPYLQDLIPVLQDLAPVIGEKIAEAIKKVDWEKLITQVATFITTIVDNLETIGKVAGVILTIAAALVTYTTATKIATTAQLLFNSAVRLNPIGLLVTGIGLAVVGFSQYADEVYGSKIETEGLTEKQKDQALKLEKLRQLQGQYKNALENSTEANRQLAEDGLRRVTDSLARTEYSLQTTSGEMNRFNNLSLSNIRNELYLTGQASVDANNKARELGLAMKGIITGTPSGRGAEAVAAASSSVGGGKSSYQLAREQVERLIKDSQKSLAQAQKQYNEAIEGANKDYAESVVRLQAEFAGKLEGIVQQSQDRLRSAYQSAVAVNIQSLFDQQEDKSVEGLVKSLSDKLTASRNLLANSASLASAGFSQTFIEQVVSAGTETGNELASAILESTPEVQSELKSLFSALEIESSQGMDTLAKEIYDRQGLATQELKDLYANTEQELADALLAQQMQLDESLIAANDAFLEAVIDIKAALTEQLAEMENGLGGMESVVQKFIGTLDDLITKYGEVGEAARLASIASPGSTAGLITTQPVPTTAPTPTPTATGGTTINVNVKTDTTQSTAMVGQEIARTVSKYTGGGGGLRGISVVAI